MCSLIKNSAPVIQCKDSDAALAEGTPNSFTIECLLVCFTLIIEFIKITITSFNSLDDIDYSKVLKFLKTIRFSE